MSSTAQAVDHAINGCKPINALEMTTYSASNLDNCEDTGSNTLWQPGQSGNPKGRPKGTRNKLSEQFLLDMHKVWTEVTEIEGKASVMALDVIRAVATKEPSKMLSAMVQVLPKDFQVSVDIDHVNWVISATPKVFERDSSEWLTEHGLQGETDETNGEAKGKQGNGQDDST